MCEDAVRAAAETSRDTTTSTSNIMVSGTTTQTHQSQDLLVPGPSPEPTTSDPPQPSSSSSSPTSPTAAAAAAMGSGPVNAITVLTLLDKLVNMLDTVQENQHKMEGRQAEMEGAVRGIQADMTKLSKSHTHTANTVSKLLDKSRKVSVTMKEVRDRMERQAGQVKKLEANHAHLLKRNNFKVLIFQEENEIPSSVFVKEPVPFPREADEGEESTAAAAAGAMDTNRSQEEEGLHTIDLSSDEEAGLEAEGPEDEALEALDQLAGEHLEKSRAEKIKRSSLKKVDSLKKAFSRQNIEKKMNKIVSQEKRDKIKKSLTPKTSTSPGGKTHFSFGLRKSKVTESQPEVSEAPAEAGSQAGDSPSTAAPVELAPAGSPDQDLSFTEVHSHLAPGLEKEEEEEEGEEAKAVADALEKEELGSPNGVPEPEEEEAPEEEASAPEAELSVTEGLSKEYALSATLPQDTSYGKSPFDSDDDEEEEEQPTMAAEVVMEEEKVVLEEEVKVAEEEVKVEEEEVKVEEEEKKPVSEEEKAVVEEKVVLEEKAEEQKEEKVKEEKEEEERSPVEKAQSEGLAS